MSHLEDDELDAQLAKQLEYDPGEAYFASFADRVSARIAAETAAAQPVAPAPRSNGLAAWLGALFTPRGIALAGGTLALLVVAGLAYRNAQHGAVSPVAGIESDRVIPSEPSAVAGDAESERQQADAPMTEASPAPTAANESSTPPATSTKELADDVGARAAKASAPQAPPSRMYEVRPGANGEDVPVRPRAIARRPTLAPVPGESDQARAKRELLAQPMRAQVASEAKTKPTASDARLNEGAAPPAVPAPFGMAERRGGMQPARDEDVAAAQEMVVDKRIDAQGQLCGTVRDASGRAVAGARVTFTVSGTGTTTDGRGAFCLPAPSAAGTLSVLAVGFRETRLSLGAKSSEPLAVTLEAVDALAKTPVAVSQDNGGKLDAGKDRQAFGGRATALAPPSQNALGKIRADAYARESAPARASVAFAREAQLAAEKAPSTEAWTVTAERWTLVASLVRGEEAAPDARYQAARARFASWELGPDDRRLRHAREAVDAFLAIAPTGPRRDTALGWKAKLGR